MSKNSPYTAIIRYFIDVNFKHIHTGSLLRRRMEECAVDNGRAAVFLKVVEEEMETMCQQASIGPDLINYNKLEFNLMKQTNLKQKRYNTGAFKIVLFVVVMLGLSPLVRGQVTVGDGTPPRDFSVLEVSTAGTKGGLRLPQLNTAQRNAWRDYFLGAATGNPVKPSGSGVTADEKLNAPGLAIFNTDTKCYEYWNESRWVSLCEGNSLMTVSPQPCTNVAADGSGCDNEFTVTDPDCLNGPFTIVIVAGADYANLYDVNEADGIFRVAFQPNNSVNLRSVVVRVTSSCTGLYKDFLFTQAGHPCDASLGNAPAITAVPSNFKFCAGGAVYLSINESAITGTGTLADVIWTRNNIEVARGVNNLVVTQEGKYDVWMGFIGCNAGTGSSVTITREGTGAPDPVSILVNGNNGMVCGPTGTTTLVAMNPNSGGTVLWFKNGILQDGTGGTQNITGTQVTVGIGNWFAVVKDASCYSRPSETVAVIENPTSGGSLTTPVIVKGGTFCAGSSVQLSVSPGTYNASYTYTWYENNTQIGMGSSVMYTVPSGAPGVVIRCRATQAGSCAQEALTVETVTTGTIPAKPAITGNTVLCSGMATLNVVPQGAGSFTYAWYKDNTPIGTTQQIIVTSGGDYYATVTDGCTSPMAHINIPATSSANPVVTLTSSSATPGLANEGDVVTYNASITFGPASNYIWTVTNATLVSGGQPGDTYAVVKYDTSGAASVKVEAFNACGSATAIRNATVSIACADPDPATVFPSGDVAVSAIAGSAFTLGPVSVNFDSGSPTTAYQWYRNTAKNYSGTIMTGKTSNTLVTSEASAGTYYYYCVMKNAGCASATERTGFYTVTVIYIPSLAGTGNFTGKTCFDIAFSNFGGDCGTEAARLTQKTDFRLTGAQDPQAGTSNPTYSGKQVYTFTPSGNISNVRFVYVDASNQAIESMTAKADYTGNISSGSLCKAVVVYKASLNEYLKGKTRANAVKPELYVIYNDLANNAGNDRAIKLTVSLQDCACCGAATTTGGWLNFMCHNLGANENLDPFTWVSNGNNVGNDIKGDLYQWGRVADGHEKRSSFKYPTNNTNTENGAVPDAALDANGQVLNSHAAYGKFIKNNSNIYRYDWRVTQNNNLWGDGSTNENMPKAANDPCPPGWKVPSANQWVSIFNDKSIGGRPDAANANTWTWTGDGFKVGSCLYLPASGSRDSGSGMIYLFENAGYYWSSNTAGQNANNVRFFDQRIYVMEYSSRGKGYSVRCVSE